jgi:hypothetical protein
MLSDTTNNLSESEKGVAVQCVGLWLCVRKSCKKGRAMSYPVQLDQILWSSGPGSCPRRGLLTRTDDSRDGPRPCLSCARDETARKNLACMTGTPLAQRREQAHRCMHAWHAAAAAEPTNQARSRPCRPRARGQRKRVPDDPAGMHVRGQETRTRGMGLPTTCGAFVWSCQGPAAGVPGAGRQRGK